MFGIFEFQTTCVHMSPWHLRRFHRGGMCYEWFDVILRWMTQPVQPTPPKVLHFSGSNSFVNCRQGCKFHYNSAHPFSPFFAASSTWDLILKLLYVNPHINWLVLIWVHSMSAVNPKNTCFPRVLSGEFLEVSILLRLQWQCSRLQGPYNAPSSSKGSRTIKNTGR